ncbi:hypothetical protein RvY_11323-1 [Ramazzottius varieornatus]|uniref:Uncharacterized protein n=1 Tax=Ramazzottius varieornatus TaxID=947166 RepID=A0A1D1VK42_RAMVA|nr:hypothetical protein RvY_11323-1 [Ramazzottius varieornatus]
MQAALHSTLLHHTVAKMQSEYLPLGTWHQEGLDPNGAAFLRYIGQKEEVANLYSSHPVDLTFSKLPDGRYNMNITQKPINRSQDIPFTLDEENVNRHQSGKTITTIFHWDPQTSTLQSQTSSNDGLSWTIDYHFVGYTLTMTRTAPSVQSVVRHVYVPS